jgi:hypothetical protein
MRENFGKPLQIAVDGATGTTDASVQMRSGKYPQRPAVRRSRHVSDPQPRAGGCRLEATHSVPPEIRTCDRRPGKLNAVLQTVPDKFGLPLRFAARNGAQRKLGRSSQDPDDRKRGDRHPSTVRAALAAYHVITATRSEPSTGCPLLRAKVGS